LVIISDNGNNGKAFSAALKAGTGPVVFAADIVRRRSGDYAVPSAPVSSRFAADQGQGIPGKYAICFPNGCFAEGAVKDDTIAAFKKGNVLSISVQNQFGQEVSFQVPLAGFGKAFDGPPIDPAVLEAQQKKLEEQMQKQAEEMRQKMQQQQGGAAPAPAPAPKQ
jgi:hypothetical protein